MSEWVGGSVADVKQPQAVLPTKHLTLTLLPASPRSIFRLFLFRRHQRLMALLGRERGGRQWRLTELNGLKFFKSQGGKQKKRHPAQEKGINVKSHSTPLRAS